MAAQHTITVPHLGGIEVGYALSNNNTYDPSRPTCVLINSMCMTVSLYRPQFEDAALTSTTNLLAIEPLGHGATRCLAPAAEHFTYWDSAIMALQVMEKLGIQKAFALGTSQGGWVVARMALLAPDRILGILPLGTSMDYESADSRSKDCWDPVTLLTPFLEKWTSETPTPDFVVDDVWCGMVAGIGFGASATSETTDFWVQTLKQVYTGDEGRKKVRMALMCLLTRDGLLLRLRDVRCPVYWLQVSESPLNLINLNATHPREVNAAIREMVTRYGA